MRVDKRGRRITEFDRKGSPRNRQLVRVLQLVEILRLQWADLDTLAGKLGVTTRTVRRDLEAIQEVYVPVTDDKDEDGVRRYRIVGRVRFAA